ncbi:hemagglutinin repeat-containing protein, partial [Pseudomonas sp.]|uniref:hemagglutinin repeat-containing protein n=1 Tax=Pseudomonas sp. TaxID=306 RepID=UPI003D0C650B
ALDNRQGELSSLAGLKLQVATLDNVAGLVTAGTQLHLNVDGALDNQGGQLTSLQTLDLKAGQVDNRDAGRIASNQALNASVSGLEQGNGGRLTSTTELTLDLNHGHLDNQGGLINAPRLALKNLDSVDNRHGEISSAQAFTLMARSLDNSHGKLLANQALTLRLDQALVNVEGLIFATGLDAQAASLDNHDGVLTSKAGLALGLADAANNQGGEISSLGTTRIKGTRLDNGDGQVSGDAALDITLSGALDNRKGMLGSALSLDLNAASLDNREGGSLVSDGRLNAHLQGLLDNQQGTINAKGALEVQASRLDNRHGSLDGKDLLTLRADTLDNRTGKLRAQQKLQLDVDQLDNRQQGLLHSLAALSFKGAHLDNRGGLLSAAGPLRLEAASLDNGTGRISSKSTLVAQLTRVLNQHGELVAEGDLELSGASLDNREGGLVGGTKALKLDVAQVDNRGGEISSSQGLTLHGMRLDNSDSGKLLAGTDLGLHMTQVLNQNQGLLFSKGAANLTGQTLDNTRGRLVAQQGLDIRLDHALDNLQGQISSEGLLNARVGNLDNTNGKLSSVGALELASSATLVNRNGSITTDAGLLIHSQDLDNSQQGLLSGKGATRIGTGILDNTQGGKLVSGDSLELKATQLSNGQGSRIASEGALDASVSGFDQQGGELFSKSALTLDLNQGRLTNHKGLINAPLLVLKNLAEVDNQDGEISSAQAFTLAARSLDNGSGKLISQQGLTLRIEQALSNLKGLVSAKTLDLHSQSLDNGAGLISSRGTQLLKVDTRLLNQDGTVIADERLELQAAGVDNRKGQVSGKAEVVARIASLDNQGGQLVAGNTLLLRGDSLDNRQGGLVGATQGLQLTVAAMDNRGGELSSRADVTLGGSHLDNGDGGKVLSEGRLALVVAEVLNRNKGLLSGKAGLGLDGSHLDNTDGLLLTQQDLKVRLQGDLDNRQGLISAEGNLTLEGQALDNRRGSVSSAQALTLEQRGDVLNQQGEIVTDGALLLASAGLDNRNAGNISAKGAAHVVTTAVDNSQNGRLNSGANLTLKTGRLTNQDGGRVASAGALDASLTGLDQQGGQLFSNTALTLDLGQGPLNNQQGLINAPLLVLKNLGQVNNQGGEISSAQAFILAAQNLDNSNGKVLSNQALTLRIDQALGNLKGLIAAAALDVRAASLDNSGGTLTSRGNLDLQLAGALNNSQQGLINAAGSLNLDSSAVDNRGGSLLGGAIAVDLGNATGDVNNYDGLISTDGQLRITHLRDLSNRRGEVSSHQSLELAARKLDNSAGKLISNQQLNLTAQGLDNQGGLVSGWQGLSANLGSLDNRNLGTLSSRSGALDAQVSGDLQNSGAGALVSQKALTVAAANLDNSNGGILSSGAGQSLSVSGLLSNAQGGLIDSGATLVLNAMTLGNASGTINAQQALSLNATRLYNSHGSLVGNAAVTLDLLGNLDNTQGKLASGGPLRIERAGQIDNQGGQLASQGLLKLFAAGLDNRNRGTVAANEQLTLHVDGALHNSGDGLIYSQNAAIDLRAASLANAKGTLQSQGALDLTTGDIDNQGGHLVAKAGDLTLAAGALDNRGGVLSSLQGALTANLDGVLKNGYDLNDKRQGGVTQAQRLSLRALAGIDNYGGRISAQSGDALISTGDFDNRNGGLYAKGLVKVTGGNFDNSGDQDGQIAGRQIDLDLSGALNNRLGIIESDSTLAIKAASLDNQAGQLRALGTSGSTRFEIGGQFDNRNGTLESANTDLSLGVGSFLNGGGSLLHVGRGTFDIATANVTGAGGSIVTRSGLTLNADSWDNSNVIQAGRLTVNVGQFSQSASGQLLASEALVGSGGNWSNDGLIASDASLSLNLSGAYSGSGRVSSRGTLGLTAGQLDLNSAASIAGGGDTSVSVAGQLNNAGRLTSAARLDLVAGGIANQGTLGAGGDLVLTTGALVNDHGLVFSGGDMGLRVESLTNSYADVYSLGNLAIDRDGKGTLANRIVNRSGSLQSDGSMALAASTIENVRAVLKTDNKGIYTARIGEIACIKGVNAGDCGGKRNHVWEVVQRDKFEVTEASAASSITAGANLTIKGGDLLNQSSTIAAGGGLVATVNNLTNSGIETGETETTRVFRSQRTKNAGSWYNVASAVTNKYWFQSAGYNPNDLDGLEGALAGFIGMTEAELPQFGKSVKIAGGDQSYAAVMQAGGAVNINAGNGIDNSVVRPGYTYIGSGARTNTDAPGTTFATRITLNQQLPPDLAQQQVNPLALPGFSLPSGKNGLFRLSGQSGSTPATTAPQSWTMGGASLSSTQRQQGQAAPQVRDINMADTAQVTARSADLNAVAPVLVQAGGEARVVDSSLPATGTVPGPVLPGRSTADAGISQPATLNGQSQMSVSVERVQGLPDSSVRSNPHKYLIETNPVLTDLKQFMSSDYLLSNLGYNPDDSAKRLGDGFYEQKLIQQAVTARTGQRFINGQDTDEKLFKYLMDNAIKSKQQLNLAVGVSLTSEQVAALTHDIVWLESTEVNGEQVLVPVLYLAHSNNRLAPNGALIAGSDLNLIAGKNLDNAGTLRATHNLSAQAGQDLVNSGLIEAGERLDLLAGNTLVNKAGGIIAGRDVSLRASQGDVINERTVTGLDSGIGDHRFHNDLLDSSARIEAANQLSVDAGRDLLNNGGSLKSGADLSLKAGRDIRIASVEKIDSADQGAHHRSQTITQSGSTVEAGRDLKAQAGRDLTAIASQIEAKRDINMTATENLTLASAADEEHAYSKTKKITRQQDQIKQVGISVKAGADVSLGAGQDLTLISSRISAGDDAYLVAGDKLELLAAQDSEYSLYDMKKKGSWGAKKTQRDEVTKVIHVGSEISAGGNLTLKSDGDQKYQAAKLESGKDITLESGGAITFEGVKDLHQESHEKSSNSLAWTSAKGKGNTDETLRQTQIVAQGKFAIQAIDGLKIDIKHIDQKSVSQTIDAMVQADPQLAWLKDTEKRGDVDWRRVQEVHDSFKYSHSGLGQGAMLAIVIVATALTAGAASGVMGTAAGASAGSGTAMAAAGSSAMVTAGTAVGTAAAGWGNVMITTALSSMAGTAAASTISNKGDLGQVLKDVASRDSLREYATASLIAGFGAAFTDGWGRELTPEGNYKTVDYVERLKAYTANTALKGVLSGKDKDSWVTIAGTGALMEIYQYSAGREPDVRSGVDREGGAKFIALEGGYVPKEVVGTSEREGINIGLNRVKGCESIFAICHGTPISQALNKIPGFNAFATLHDGWMDNLEVSKGAEMSLFENLGSMPPALLVNYGALYYKYRPLIDTERKREKN